MVRLGWMASVALALGCASAEAADHAWQSGFGQGILEASVENRDGGRLSVHCPAGQEDTTPGLTVETRQAFDIREGAVADIVLVVDDAMLPLRAVHGGGYDGAAHFGFRADDHGLVASLEAVVDRLRRGRAVTVELPPPGRPERFSPNGSAAALAGILEGCEKP